MDVWNSLWGMVEVELISASPEGCLESVGQWSTDIWNVKKHSELMYSFCIPKNKYGALKVICDKRGDRVRLRRKIGLYWMVRRILARPILMSGAVLFLSAALWLPSRVFFVQVEGNARIPARAILSAAEECGVAFGASRREVRSERVKNALLCAVPELQWAGVNTFGCTAVISVREKAESEQREQAETVSSILAARDGYVLSSTATAGTLQVKAGDSVRKGQILISAYTDCGLCIRAEQAEGEVFAQTRRNLNVVMPSRRMCKGVKEGVKRKYSLRLRKKRIILWKDSGIWDGTCGRMYKEYYITLPGGFRLPAAFCVETYTGCQIQPVDVSEEDARGMLKSFAEGYLHREMVAGRIISGFQMMQGEADFYCMTGTYICEEMISTVRQEQIGDTNGKIS